ncbi:MAG: redoxin domain-containing protein [Siphonobacter sp.]
MKKTLRILFPFLILGLLTLLFFGIRRQFEIRSKVEKATATLPAETFNGLNGKTETFKNRKGNAVFLVFFHSECDYCQNEARLLHENREVFSPASVYLLSAEPQENIRAFKEKYLPGNDDFTVGQIDGEVASAVFGVKSFPHTLIYDKDSRLVKTYKGIVKLEALTAYIQ